MLEFPTEIPGYDVAYAEAPPAVDGWLESPCWRQAKWVERFISTETGEAVAHPACAALLWDERCLYLGMKVSEPRLAYVRAEGDASADDAIELYLNPGVPEVEYLTLAVNPLGQLCLTVHLIDNPGWGTDHPRETGGIRAAARLTGAGWQVEVAIPFGEHQLPIPKIGDAWRGNICRGDKLNYAWSYWSLRDDALADYNDVQLFPYLRFTGKQPAVQPVAVAQPAWPGNPAICHARVHVRYQPGVDDLYPRLLGAQTALPS